MEDNIRVIQYLGSKLKILDAIKKEIDRVTTKDGTVVDLFAGTGVVANYLASGEIRQFSGAGPEGWSVYRKGNRVQVVE